jgi:hypothetical protein
VAGVLICYGGGTRLVGSNARPWQTGIANQIRSDTHHQVLPPLADT